MAIITIRSNDPNYGIPNQRNKLTNSHPLSYRLFPEGTDASELPDFQPVPNYEWSEFRKTFLLDLIRLVGRERILQSEWTRNERQSDGLFRTDDILARGFNEKAFVAIWPENADESDVNALRTQKHMKAPDHLKSCQILVSELGYVFDIEVNMSDAAAEDPAEAEVSAEEAAEAQVPEEGAPAPEDAQYDKFLKDQHPTARDIENLRRELENMPRNLIVFGAPGTGKSFYLEDKRKEYEKHGLLGEPDSKHWERVTFHPDYSYANFVGTYKPTADGRDITYKFVPGPFLRLLVEALKHPELPYLLIVEEINRAEPAAVFGDVFQLLDRNKDNKSEYAICPSEDMKAYLAENSIGSDTLSLPENFYLWATMNSADQGVFPMDTAFKRRWDFKYIGVDDNATELENETIELKPNNSETQKFYWDPVRRKINDRLAESKINEDKQLGPFFLKLPKNDAGIDAERFADLFKNKVLMYLYEDAARQKRNTMFEGCKDETRFSKLCEKFDEIGLKIFGDGFCEGICLSEEEVRLEQQAEEEFEEAQQEQADEIREEAPAEA